MSAEKKLQRANELMRIKKEAEAELNELFGETTGLRRGRPRKDTNDQETTEPIQRSASA